ncbi:MAG: hypothetical protein EP332_07950 [Bacteroidetes bacterium]|nr:MAG: hypothetical protein EP332_07950 [Bacteroidota bacterium]
MRLFKRQSQVWEILDSYTAKGPVSLHLKAWAKQHKEAGSKDRRELQAMVYAWFRLGHLGADKPKDQRLAAALFLFQDGLEHYTEDLFTLELLPKSLHSLATAEWSARFEALLAAWDLNTADYFPYLGELSDAFSADYFIRQMSQAPHFWFRSRRKRSDELEQVLNSKKVEFIRKEQFFAFHRGFNLISVLPKKQAIYGEVQDYASGRTVELLKLEGKEKVWDVCAASGGKSLAILDRYPNLRLMCSDVRPAILRNLEARIKETGLPVPEHKATDIANKPTWPFTEHIAPVDVLVCDVPCSGSGTWSRNPERISLFSEAELDALVPLQAAIVKNAAQFLRKGGQFLYITCSVFKKENEDQVQALLEQGFELVESGYLGGPDEGADTLYRALLRKS